MEGKRMLRLVKKDKNDVPVLYEDGNVPYWIEGLIDTPVGKVRVMKTSLDSRDRIGGFKARWGINRNDYKVSPGLYAIGNPDSKSNVLVTANYKFTVDKLRQELGGLNLWVIVLDTNGINVWCAAGKGTFGTSEVISRIRRVQLDRVVEHRTIILPQLGASGVSAHTVTKLTGFKVLYGPVRSRDIGEYINSGFKASKGMREVRFNLADRIALTPVEIVMSLKYIPMIYAALFILNLINPAGVHMGEALKISAYNLIPYVTALFIGTFFVPVLLPYLPFRAFSLKGAVLGVIWAIVVVFMRKTFMLPADILVLGGHFAILISIASYLGLNFTGSSTYTSLSGVKLETKWTVILTALASIAGLLLIVIEKITGFIR